MGLFSNSESEKVQYQLDNVIAGWAKEIASLDPVIRRARMAYLEDIASPSGERLAREMGAEELDGQKIYKKLYELTKRIIDAEEFEGQNYAILPVRFRQGSQLEKEFNERTLQVRKGLPKA